jgi:ribosomal protein S21
VATLLGSHEGRAPRWRLTQVVRGQYEPFDALIRRFTKKLQQSGILAEARWRMAAVPRGERMRLKRRSAAKRRLRARKRQAQ